MFSLYIYKYIEGIKITDDIINRIKTMPRKKSEFKRLTQKEIVSRNPKRKNQTGDKNLFEKLITKSTKQEPFDKK